MSAPPRANGKKKPPHILLLEALGVAANCHWHFRDPRDENERILMLLSTNYTSAVLMGMLLNILRTARLSPAARLHVATGLAQLRDQIGSELGAVHQEEFDSLVNAQNALEAEIELAQTATPTPVQN